MTTFGRTIEDGPSSIETNRVSVSNNIIDLEIEQKDLCK